ncbi:hypothetical protein PVK06_031929 [Gossypium arboreum]|uniref:Uncharacterized protein n=1 Tax=Gossypium arboreum TaxID=29729 RepID=A0ABR0NSF3_GOSAR|nr:hypothetical protein PVK06_031929 [Gossypium arboreum]
MGVLKGELKLGEGNKGSDVEKGKQAKYAPNDRKKINNIATRKRPTSPQLQRRDLNTLQAGNYGGKTSNNEKAGSPETDNHPRSTAKRRRTVSSHSPPTTIVEAGAIP